MEIPVVIEYDLDGDGVRYKARCRHPVAAEGTGETRFRATESLRAALAEQGVPGPFELIPLEVTESPWMAAAGWLADDELTRQYLDAVAAHRREQDARDRADAP